MDEKLKRSLIPFLSLFDEKLDKVKMVIDLIRNDNVNPSNFKVNQRNKLFYGMLSNSKITPVKLVQQDKYTDLTGLLSQSEKMHFESFYGFLNKEKEFYFYFKLKE